MTDLLTLHKYFLSQHLRRGGVAVDFTMGNGHDTQYLCNAVYGGEAAPGKVYAFDIQQAAVDSTARLLRESGTPENYTLICASHDRVAEFVHEPFDAWVFNLGWLPGSDKKVTTQRSSTLPAIEAAVSLLAPGGSADRIGVLSSPALRIALPRIWSLRHRRSLCAEASDG